MTQLVCTKCGKAKDETLFAITRRRKTGRSSDCKECRAASFARYRKNNLEKRNRNNQRWRERHPGGYAAWKEKNPTYHEKWRAEHPTYWEDWRAEHPTYHEDRLAKDPAYFREWRKNNPEKIAGYLDSRDQRIQNSPYLEDVPLDEIYKRDKGICQICFKRCKRNEASRDHIVPLSKGGEHSKRNIVLAHRRCNSRKRNRLITQQLLLLG